MIKQTIIAIGREYGTGGHEIARKLAAKLEYNFYDRDMLEQISKSKNMDLKEWVAYEKKVSNPLISKTALDFSNTMDDILAQMEFDFIREKAMSGESFVIVGRCAESVLRGNDNLVSVFLLGDDAFRISNVTKRFDISDSDAIAKIRRHHMSRKKYHNKYSKYNWGDSRSYDLTMNISRLTQEQVIETIINYIRFRENSNN